MPRGRGVLTSHKPLFQLLDTQMIADRRHVPILRLMALKPICFASLCESPSTSSQSAGNRIRFFRLFLLIPCWESQRLIPKRSAGPRATKIGVVSLKALDHHRPNREESAVLPLNYPPQRPQRDACKAHLADLTRAYLKGPP